MDHSQLSQYSNSNSFNIQHSFQPSHSLQNLSYTKMHYLLPLSVTFLAFLSGSHAVQYTFSAYAPANHILDHLKVEAADFSFNLGLTSPATYCPEPPSICPPGNETVFYSPYGLVNPFFPLAVLPKPS